MKPIQRLLLVLALTLGGHAVAEVVEQDPIQVIVEAVEYATEANQRMAGEIAKQYNCQFSVAALVVDLAEKYSHPVFPTKLDILATIAIESRFNPNASYRGSKGLMQVLISSHRKDIPPGRFDIEQQIKVGALIHKQNYSELHNAKASVMAYNVGLGAYKKGKRPNPYWDKFRKALDWFKYQQRLHLLV